MFFKIFIFKWWKLIYHINGFTYSGHIICLAMSESLSLPLYILHLCFNLWLVQVRTPSIPDSSRLSGGEAGFPFFVVTSVWLSYTFYKRTHTYIYLIVPAREMPQCLQCWRDDVGSFQSKCYMENKWNIMNCKFLCGFLRFKGVSFYFL